MPSTLTAGESLAFGVGAPTAFERRGDTIAGLQRELLDAIEDYRLVQQEDDLILHKRLELVRRGRALMDALTQLGGELAPECELPDDFKPIKVDKSAEPVLVERYAYDACKHFRTLLSMETRVIRCRDCGASLDPLKVIERYWSDRAQREREGDIYKKYVDDYNAVESSKARRYNERHRKTHPSDIPSCSVCAHCESNQRRWGDTWMPQTNETTD